MDEDGGAAELTPTQHKGDHFVKRRNAPANPAASSRHKDSSRHQELEKVLGWGMGQIFARRLLVTEPG